MIVPLNVLELFSGTHSVGKVCRERGWEVTSCDLQDADIIDIMKWDYKKLPPHTYDVIWASPPCTYFSTLQFCHKTHAEINELIQTQGLPLLRRTEEIIDYFKPTYYFMENPYTGSMKKYVDKPYYVVDYCQYCDWGYKKPTIIWTNKLGFIPKRCTHKKHEVLCGNVSKKNKYRIPPMLITSLFDGI